MMMATTGGGSSEYDNKRNMIVLQKKCQEERGFLKFYAKGTTAFWSLNS